MPLRTGNSPLIEATKVRRLSIIDLLLENDADVTIRNQEEKHALDYAQEKGLDEVAENYKKLLINASLFSFSSFEDISDVQPLYTGGIWCVFRANFMIGDRATTPSTCSKVPNNEPNQKGLARY
eukprot:TRINITY_DN1927_c0_g1_i2.p1 TRINITY_DN1927_c0_g1~~TRINITY_DN1927_c0_g1_i2.p1  ORF type:complete len:124 (-),score=10.46 TRINITY_DN1927_c0_g1_i2:865-1236(-)